MTYPLLIDPERVKEWSQQLIAQLQRDRDEIRARFGMIVEPAISSGAVELDLAKGDTFLVELVENLTTINVIEPRATDEQRFDFMLRLAQDGMGSRTVSFPAGWLWAGGSAPTVTATANAEDLFAVSVIDRAFYARTLGQDFS